MKKLLFCFFSCLLSTSAFAALPAIPATDVPATGDPLTQQEHGIFSSRDKAAGAAVPDPRVGGDPDGALVKTFENFMLTGAYNLSGLCWHGIYDEAFPSPIQDTDFIVEIWSDAAGVPNLGAGPVMAWSFEGGATAGTGGADLTVTPLEFGGVQDVSLPTADPGPIVITPGGGLGFSYEATIGGTLGPGSYWISIIADQDFTSPVANDPIWQWHVGGPAPDSIVYQVDRALASEGLLDLQSLGSAATTGLAFELKGAVVPEPTAAVLALGAVFGLGLVRRKR